MQKYLTPLVEILLAFLDPPLCYGEHARQSQPKIAHIAYTAGLIDVETGLRPTHDRGSHRGQRPSADSRKERDARG